jgi:hypothetical protein
MVSDPDSIVEYVRHLDAKYNRLLAAIREHEFAKNNLDLIGLETHNEADEKLWAIMKEGYREQAEG